MLAQIILLDCIAVLQTAASWPSSYPLALGSSYGSVPVITEKKVLLEEPKYSINNCEI